MASVFENRPKRKWYLRFKDRQGVWRSRSSGIALGDGSKERNRNRHRAEAMLARVVRELEGDGPDFHPGPPTVRSYAAIWLEDRERRGVGSVKDERSRLQRHVLPLLGDHHLALLRPREVRDMVRELRQKASARGGQLAPRTVRHIYMTLHRMLHDAVVDERIDRNPAVLKKNELPGKIDRDPAWRSTAVFTRSELEQLLVDERIPEDRRILTALLALGAMRFGEAAARRWRDYDATVQPLGKLVIATSYDGKAHLEKSVKTEQPREMAVHPTLARLLAAWRNGGFERMLGRRPEADDLIIPSRRPTSKRQPRPPPLPSRSRAPRFAKETPA